MLGSDHAGRSLRLAAVAHLTAAGHQVIDLGCEGAAPVDYPRFAVAVAQAIVAGEGDLGLTFCGTGIGMSMAANRVKGCRAAVCQQELAARMAREHNDANVLCIGARLVGSALALATVDAFVATGFAGGRHLLRVNQLSALERR